MTPQMNATRATKRIGSTPLKYGASAVSALALFCASALAPVHAATITVDNASDAVIAGNGECTLREAVMNANANDNVASGADCAAGEGGGVVDVINMGAVTYPLVNGELAISDAVIFNQNNAASTIDAAATSRIFNATAPMTLNNVTLVNGLADGAANPANSGGAILTTAELTVNGGAMNNNTSVRAGGAIEAQGDNTVTLNNVDFSGNDAGAGPGNGGVLHVSGAADVVVTGGSFTGNTAQEGGVLWNNAGTMTVTDSNFSMNNATCNGSGTNLGGGALFNLAGTLTVTGSTSITGNNANGAVCSGGGILTNDGTTLNVMDGVTISGNTANRAGGGIEMRAGSTATIGNVTMDANTANTTGTGAGGNGGAIHITGDGDATLTGGTYTNNIAASEGGGLWNGAGTMTVDGSTITGNTANGGTADAGDADGQGGGGIFNEGGTVTVMGSTSIMSNVAAGAVSSGGGIFSKGALNVMDGVTISDNTANRAGGGIEMRAGTTATIGNVTMNNNTANTTAGGGGGNGGAIHITGNGNATLTGGSYTNNEAAAEGGALWNGGGTMTVDGSTITDNIANGGTADTGDNNAQGGGGIFNEGGTVNVENSTVIRNNQAAGNVSSGGGIFTNVGTTLNVIGGVVIADNTANRAGGGIESRAGSTTSLLDMTLEGNTANVTAGGGGGNGGGMHITGDGDVTADAILVVRNMADTEGGGLWNSAGTMTVMNSSLIDNMGSGAGAANGGGALFNNGGGGAGVITVTNSRLLNNSADGTAGSGGAILALTGTVNVTDSVIAGNTANRAGGGVEVATGATVNLTRVTLGGTSSVAGNNAQGTGTPPGNGGGLHIGGTGTAVIANSSVGFNQAREGGGLWNSNEGSLTVSNTTISNNTARASTGGGIHLDAGSGASSTNIFNAITVARNSATAGSGIAVETGVPATANSSLIVENSGDNVNGMLAGSANLQDVTGAIGRYEIRGGFTATHELVSSFAGVDGGSSAACGATDQRGAARPAACDQGAFERIAADENVVVASNNRASTTVTAGTNTVLLAFGLTNNSASNINVSGITGQLRVNEANRIDSVENVRTFIDVNGNGLLDPGTDMQVASTNTFNTDGSMTVTFTGNYLLEANSDPDFLVIANLDCETDTASAVTSTSASSMAKPAVAGSVLLGLFAILSLGIRRRTQLLLVAVLAVAGLTACSDNNISLIPGENTPAGADGSVADANAEIAGEVQLALTSVNSGDVFVVSGLPINGPGISCP